MKKTEKQIQQGLKNGAFSPSELIRMCAERTGNVDMWRLSLRVDHPKRYPEYEMTDESERRR